MAQMQYIHKLLLGEIDGGRLTFKVAQVGAMPLLLPVTLAFERQMDGLLGFDWKWMPGEPTNHIAFDRLAPLGPSLERLVQQMRATKPWQVEAAE